MSKGDGLTFPSNSDVSQMEKENCNKLEILAFLSLQLFLDQ